MATKFRGDKFYLSNMYSYPIMINGNEFSCVEAAFQSFKSLDPNTRKSFVGLNGFQAKKLCQRVKLRPDWEEIKVDVMREILRVKFSRELGDKLVLENDDTLTEENDWGDTYWGTCNGRGKNMLGKLLREIRDEIIDRRQ